MQNIPRFGRPWQRQPVVAPPFPAAVPPSAPTAQTLQPFEPNPPPSAHPPSSPLNASPRGRVPSESPKYRDAATRVANSPAKSARSPPASPATKYSDRRHAQTTPPHSPAKPRRTTTPPLSPLALPRTQVTSANGATVQSRVLPEEEKKSVLYNKTVEKPAKSGRPSEHGSGKVPQAEVVNLTGHNVGAVMEINQSSNKHSGGEIIKKKETETELGGAHRGNDEKKTGAKKELPVTAFMNSNFQSVNNSVMYDSSCSHRDPGLHLAFPDAADGGGAIVDGHNKNYKP